MLNNHALIVIEGILVLLAAWGLSDRRDNLVLGCIICGAVCGLAIGYNLLNGQPIW